MAYTKTTWVDRLVEFANRFAKSNETSSSVMLTADPGTVTQAGTPLSAANLNKMEQGIADAHDLANAAGGIATDHALRTNNPHSVTATQVGLGNVQNYGIATQAEAEAGTSGIKYMTPQRVKQYADTRLENGIKFRINAGVAEFWDGTGWKVVASNKVAIASNTVRKTYATQVVCSGTGSGSFSRQIACKFVPEAVGEMIIKLEARGAGADFSGAGQMYINSPVNHTQHYNAEIASNVLFDWRLPVGTVINPGNTVSGEMQLSPNAIGDWKDYEYRVKIHSTEPVYILIVDNSSNVNNGIRNVRLCYDIVEAGAL